MPTYSKKVTHKPWQSDFYVRQCSNGNESHISHRKKLQENHFDPLTYLKNVLYCYIESEVTDKKN